MSSGEATSGTSSNAIASQGQNRRKSGQEPPITGVVNRVKVPDANERDAVLSDPSIKTVMLSIDSARKLVHHHDETAGTYFRNDQTVITTTTTHDETLRELDWSTELDLVREFGPDYHIPTEYSVYQTMPRSQQQEAIDDCMDGTEWMAGMLENHSTEVLVQAKGWLSWQFRRCLPTMRRLDTRFIVFYATGYKNRVYELKYDLNALVSQINPSGILLIGKQSIRFLRRAIPEVVSAAGGRWRRKSGLTDEGHDPKEHSNWKTRVEKKLSCGQAILDSYESTEVNEHG
jgi:hypothetical protein